MREDAAPQTEMLTVGVMASVTTAVVIAGIACFNSSQRSGEGGAMLMLTGDVMLGRGIDHWLRHLLERESSGVRFDLTDEGLISVRPKAEVAGVRGTCAGF